MERSSCSCNPVQTASAGKMHSVKNARTFPPGTRVSWARNAVRTARIITTAVKSIRMAAVVFIEEWTFWRSVAENRSSAAEYAVSYKNGSNVWPETDSIRPHS